MNIIKNLMLLCFVAFPLASYAGHGESSEEEKPPISNISYFDLSPEIVTNYAAPGRKVGFIRVKVQLMTDSPGDVAVLEYHAPMIRDVIITTLNRKTQADFSATGFEEIRRECKNQIEEFLQKEEGHKVLRDILFTNAIWE